MEEKETQKPIKNDIDLSLQTEKCEELKLESLFPLKIDIPDYLSSLAFSYIGLNHTLFSFLFSSEVEFKDIKIEDRNKIYHLGEIIKTGKTFSVFYIEALYNSTFKINFPKFTNPVFVKIDKDKFITRSNLFFFSMNRYMIKIIK